MGAEDALRLGVEVVGAVAQVVGKTQDGTMVGTYKFRNDIVPEAGEINDLDRAAIEEFKNVKTMLNNQIERFLFHEALKGAKNMALIGCQAG